MDRGKIVTLGEFINKSLFDGSAKTNPAFDEGVILFTQQVLTLLKEQEPEYVNNIAQQISCFSGTCPKCGKMLNTTCNKNFCGDCGQVVKWNA